MLSLEDSRIDFVLCRHEQAAAFMADAYGRLTGKAGACLSTLGPGATNLVTGLADANMDRAPVVAIIGQDSTRRLHKESHQNMDAIGMMEPISKWAQTVRSAETVPEIVHKAFKIAETEKPGVTVIELPKGVAKEDVDKHVMAPSVTRRPAADDKAVRSAIDAIEQATNPIILAGNGALRKRAAKQLRHFAHKTGIPVVNTFIGKGAIAMSDPHCLFTMGLQGRDHVNKAFEKSDTVITVGYDLVEIAPIFWNPDCDKTIIHIDFTPAVVARQILRHVRQGDRRTRTDHGSAGRSLRAGRPCRDCRTGRLFRKPETDQATGRDRGGDLGTVSRIKTDRSDNRRVELVLAVTVFDFEYPDIGIEVGLARDQLAGGLIVHRVRSAGPPPRAPAIQVGGAGEQLERAIQQIAQNHHLPRIAVASACDDGGHKRQVAQTYLCADPQAGFKARLGHRRRLVDRRVRWNGLQRRPNEIPGRSALRMFAYSARTVLANRRCP